MTRAGDGTVSWKMGLAGAAQKAEDPTVRRLDAASTTRRTKKIPESESITDGQGYAQPSNLMRRSLTERRFSVYSNNSEYYHDPTTTQKGRYCSRTFTTFGNSKRSQHFSVTVNPGPGQYETLRKSFITPRPGNVMNMKFGIAKTESRADLQDGGSDRSKGSRKPPVPKQGKQPGTFGAPRSKTFGNTFRGMADNPGPGTYETDNSFALGAQALRSKNQRSGVTFGTSKRTHFHDKAPDNPGPGSYDLGTTILADTSTPWRNNASPVAYREDLETLYKIFGYARPPNAEHRGDGSDAGTVDKFLEEQREGSESPSAAPPGSPLLSARSARSAISQQNEKSPKVS